MSLFTVKWPRNETQLSIFNPHYLNENEYTLNNKSIFGYTRGCELLFGEFYNHLHFVVVAHF